MHACARFLQASASLQVCFASMGMSVANACDVGSLSEYLRLKVRISEIVSSILAL